MLKDVSVDADKRCPREYIEALFPTAAKDSPEQREIRVEISQIQSIKAILHKLHGLIDSV